MGDSLTDLHTHILPGVDDGAQDLETALQILRVQKENHVERTMLTPHFYLHQETPDSFLERRQRAFDELMEKWDEKTMPLLHLGAEVRYTPKLSEVDLRPLALGGSDYLLLELADVGIPAYVELVVEGMLRQGITPVLAHVERCEYLYKTPERLVTLVRMGALAQISVRSLKSRRNSKFPTLCLNRGLAHVIASDVHRLSGSATCLGSALTMTDEATVLRAEEFAQAVWNNECPPAFSVGTLKKGIFDYQ